MERLTKWNEQTEQAELLSWDEEEWKDFMGSLDVPIVTELSIAINELAEYEDLEEQGLLLRLPAPLNGVEMFELEGVGLWLRLPCKPGDKVYEIEGIVQKGYDWKYPSYENAYARETIFTLEKYNSFGLSIFLTKEECEKKIAEKVQEAEAALKEMEEKIDGRT